jgi:hypothetical protein
LKSFAARTLAPRSRAQAASAWPRKCSEGASAEAMKSRQRGFVLAFAGEEIRHHRLALGDGAGLVEDQGGELARGLQRLAVADVDAAPRRLAGADHDGGGRGQSQRAGAGDEQHGDGMRQRARRRVAGQQPAAESQSRQHADRRHEARRDAVGELLHRQLGGLGVVDHLHDAGEHGVAAHRGGAQREAAGAVDAAADDRVARRLGHRQRFAGDEGLVHRRAAVLDDAVGGHAVARAHAQQVADLHLVDRHDFLDAAGAGARPCRAAARSACGSPRWRGPWRALPGSGRAGRRRRCRRPTRNRRGGGGAARPAGCRSRRRRRPWR